MKQIKNISIIGAGNVATHISIGLKNKGYTIDYVYSRDIRNAENLANLLDANACSDIANLDGQSDFYLLCVKDDAIEEVLSKLSFRNKTIAHTSGSISMEVFSSLGFDNYGVFYPLQTFSKDKAVEMTNIPFCIEANMQETENTLFQLANEISEQVSMINSEQRKTLHLAAVFACNFTNHFYSIADGILKEKQMSFDLLRPLILETAKKVQEQRPADVQTGPAARNDLETINAHLQMLAGSENLKHLYGLISEGIIKEKNGKEL